MNTKLTVKQLDDLLEVMDNLTKRLQDDYNGIRPFKQFEEDRIVTYHICELLEEERKKATS